MEIIYTKYRNNELIGKEIESLKNFETEFVYTDLLETNDADVNEFLRLKYQDIKSDYQLLNSKNYKIIELINKKILLLNQISSESYRNDLLIKIIELCLILNYDFRKFEILKFLNRQDITVNNKFTESIYIKYQTQRIVTRTEFEDFLNHCETKIISKLDKSRLLNNLLEYNLSILSNYFKSIYIERLENLLQLTVDLTVIIRMISRGDLYGRINQLDNLIIFKEDQIDNEVEIFTMVDNISNKI